MTNDSDISPLARGVRAALARCPGSATDKARALGVSMEAVRRWKEGVAEPSESNLARLARRANVEQSWIRNGGHDDAR